MLRYKLNNWLKTFVLSFSLLISLNLVSQENILLDRSYWKSQPSLTDVQQKIKEGNSPSEMNPYKFDPLIYAILEKAPNNVLEYLQAQKGNDVNKITHDGRTYIFWAAYKDNISFMKYLLNKGAATDVIDEYGYSLLNFAAVTGQQNPALYDFIIENDDKALNGLNHEGANALLLVLPHLKSPDLIGYFQEKGMSLKSTDKDGNGAFNHAAKGGNIDMLNWLIEQGVDYTSPNKEGGTAMHFASAGMRRHHNTVDVFRYLKEKGLDPNKATNEGITPLMTYAFDGSDPTAFEFFLKNGASVDQADNKGNTALINAAGFNSVEIVKLLMNESANTNIVNKKGQSALMMATQYNSSEAMNLLLSKGSKAPIFDEDGNGALYYLVQSYSSKTEEDFNKKMKLLKENKVDFKATEPTGNSLFHLAADKDITSLIELANEGGLDVNAKNKEGMTPLLIAAMKSKDGESLKYLVSIGADKSIKTDFEESAYQLASENELLQKAKFDINFLAK